MSDGYSGPIIRDRSRGRYKLPWPNRYATPAWSLRCLLNRCQAGPWRCWRRAVEEWPMAACERHRDNDLMKLGRMTRQLYESDASWREVVDAAIKRGDHDR